MLKKLLSSVIALLLVTLVACSFPRVEPPDTEIPPNSQPHQEEGEQQNQRTPVPTQPPENLDALPNSDEDSVEENINGFDISDDHDITRQAESLLMTQINTAVDQTEIAQLPEINTNNSSDDIVMVYEKQLPEQITYGVQYEKYNLTYDYFLITSENEITIYENPNLNSREICSAINSEKLALHQKLTGQSQNGSDIWYKVSCKENDKLVTGYIHSSAGTTRTFQFNKMLDAIQDLQSQVSEGKLNHVSNYKNVNGVPPDKGQGGTDEFGMRIYQSAPGYLQADTQSDFRYVPDGMLVRILEDSGEFYRTEVDSYNQELYIPKNFIDPNDALADLTQVVVIDRKQQNQAAFELSGNEIRMISYTLSTTGVGGRSSFETPLGTYKTIEKKERFQYLKKDSNEIAGYAPYAIRFCGGAYIHGVPVNYEEKDGELIDPGIIEYLQTIGTFPRSSMCVRNFSSHAEFLYNWIEPTNGAVIVIE